MKEGLEGDIVITYLEELLPECVESDNKYVVNIDFAFCVEFKVRNTQQQSRDVFIKFSNSIMVGRCFLGTFSLDIRGGVVNLFRH